MSNVIKETTPMNPCKRKQVAAMGFDGIRVAWATNGQQGECTEEPGACGCTHAEVRLLRILPRPIGVWVSMSPCLDCAKRLVAAGVQEVEFQELYRLHAGMLHLIANGVRVIHSPSGTGRRRFS